jgi:hypothetical protein
MQATSIIDGKCLKPLLALVLLLAASASVSPQGVTPRRLTFEEGRKLALAALESDSKKLPGLDVENYSNPNFPDFYFFSVTWGTARSERGGTVEQIAVDAITGDVWDGVVCRKITSPSLRKLQSSVRQQIGLSKSEYLKLTKKGPMC